MAQKKKASTKKTATSAKKKTKKVTADELKNVSGGFAVHLPFTPYEHPGRPSDPKIVVVSTPSPSRSRSRSRSGGGGGSVNRNKAGR